MLTTDMQTSKIISLKFSYYQIGADLILDQVSAEQPENISNIRSQKVDQKHSLTVVPRARACDYRVQRAFMAVRVCACTNTQLC